MLSHISKIKHYIFPFIYTCIFFVCALLILNRTIPRTGIDSEVYRIYTESIIHDYDYNIINNIKDADRWLVSSSYNYPDMHNPNFSIFLAPFYIYTKLFFKALKIDTNQIFKNGVRDWASMANLFFGFIAIYLFLIISKFKNIYNIILITFATPFFYYIFFDSINSDIIQAFLLSLILYILFHNPTDFKYRNHMLFFLFALSCAVKISFYFYIFPLLYLIFSNPNKVKNILLFSGSLIFFILLEQITIFLKFDHVSISSGYTDNISHSLNVFGLKLLLFGPIGYFIVSPLLLLIFLLFFYFFILEKKYYQQREIIIALFLFSIIVKIIIFSFWMWGEDGFGARHLVIDTPVFLLALNSIIYSLNKYKKWIFFMISTICFTPAIIYLTWFYKLESTDSFYLHNIIYPQWNQLSLSDFRYMLKNIFIINPYHIGVAQIIFISILSLILYLTLYLLRHKIWTTISYYILISISVYILFFSLNLSFNKSNVTELKQQGIFSDSVVVKGMHANMYLENISEIGGLVNYCQYYNNRTCLTSIYKYLSTYKSLVINEVLIDPINFCQQLENGIFHYTKSDEQNEMTNINNIFFKNL